MILHPTGYDPHFGLHHYLVSHRRLIHMGVFRVMYGFRVRAGFVADRWGCTLDWCGGGNWADVERLYSLCKAILEARSENAQCFDGLPTQSAVKPFYNDPAFVLAVFEAAGDVKHCPLEPITDEQSSPVSESPG